MMRVQRFVQLAQADAAPSPIFPASNHQPSVFRDHRLVLAYAVDAANAA